MRRLVLALLAPLLLASCFFAPGKFTSDMRVGADRSFEFAYRGEIVFITDPNKLNGGAADVGDLAEQKCWGAIPDSKGVVAPLPAGESPKERDCTPGEIAQQKKWREESAERQKLEAKRMAQLIGFDPSDEASMREFTAQLEKHAGWRSVRHKGGGVFEVDYRVTGALDRDFVFPVFPRVSAIFPMVVARVRADGAVQVSAPAFAGLAGNTMTGGSLIGMMGMDGLRPGGKTALPAPDGTFTITTDAEILTNNTEDGPRDGPRDGAGAQTLSWRVTGASQTAPEALLRPRR